MLSRHRHRGPKGRGRRSGQVPKGPTGQDRVGVRHGDTVLICHKTAERIGCTQVVQPVGVKVTHRA